MIDYNKLTLVEAKKMQFEFQSQLKFELPEGFEPSTIAGADISFNKGSNEFFGAVVVLNYPSLTLKSFALAKGESDFPYVPGYLGFREVPTLLNAWELLPTKPDVVVLDGQGILHPRRMGIASHFGVLTKVPTIGCAKTSLYGYYNELLPTKFAEQIVFEQDIPIGYALRSKDHNKPLFISPGYGLSLSASLSIIKKCIRKHRMPETTRMAHMMANDFRTGKLKEGYTVIDEIPNLFS